MTRATGPGGRGRRLAGRNALRPPRRPASPPARILVDPGIGFGKLLAAQPEPAGPGCVSVAAGRPLLLGASRKGFIGQITGAPAEAAWGQPGGPGRRLRRPAPPWSASTTCRSVQFLEVLAAIAEAAAADRADDTEVIACRVKR